MDLLTIGILGALGFGAYKIFSSGEEDKKKACAPAEQEAAYQMALYALIRPSEILAVADYLKSCGDNERAKTVSDVATAVSGMSKDSWLSYASEALRYRGEAQCGSVVSVRYKDTEEIVNVTINCAPDVTPEDCTEEKANNLYQAVIYTVFYPDEADKAAKQLRKCGFNDLATAAEQKATALSVMGDAEWLQVAAASLFYAGGKPGQTVIVRNRRPDADPEFFEVIVTDPNGVKS